MKKYITYFKLSLQMNMTYKIGFLFYVGVNIVFFFIQFALWKSIYQDNGIQNINSYTLSNLVTYYFMTSFIFQFKPDSAIYLNDDIWSGYLTNDLIRAWSPIWAQAFYAFSETVMQVLAFLPFWVIILFYAHSYLSFPGGLMLLAFAVTLLLVYFMALFFYDCVHALGFFFGDQNSNIGLITAITVFLGGGIFPLALLPSGFRAITDVLPFKYFFSVPVDIYLGKYDWPQIFMAWGWIIFWLLLFYFIFTTMFRRGLKHYTATGR